MATEKEKGPMSPSNRNNKAAPQHRGVRSGGNLPSGDAKSPKYGGNPIEPPRK